MVASAYRRHAQHAKSLAVAVRATARGIPVTGLPQERLRTPSLGDRPCLRPVDPLGPVPDRTAGHRTHRPAGSTPSRPTGAGPHHAAQPRTRRDAKGYASRINAA